MLYGNLIFIKKTGGDGSKYPVTEKDIKIGRSDNCLIRIYNPQVALEHCQIIIEHSGQATLRNLSNQTILNGKPLTQENVTLCHGDIFQLGERLARWEYLPTSKFYKQLLSPTGRLVAVVMPQQRSLEDQGTPGTSASQVSVLKTTPLGKRRFSERATSENSSAVKIRKSNGSELIHKGQGDLKKLLTTHHSFKTTKLLLKGSNVKERKSISGIISSKSSKGKVNGKYRKSTLPSWKVNIVSPPGRKSSGSKKSSGKSNEKSGKSPQCAVQTLGNDVTGSNPDKLLQSESKSGIKTPHKIVRESKFSEKLIQSPSLTVLKTPLKTKLESPVKFTEGSARATRSLSKSPLLKKPSLKSPSRAVLSTPKQKSKFARLVHSESKLKSTSVNPSVLCRAGKRMSLILEKVDSTPRQSLIKEFRESVPQEKTKTPKIRLSGIISDSIIQIPPKTNKVTPGKRKISSLKNASMKSTSNKLEKTPRKSSANKKSKSPVEEKEKISRRSLIVKENVTQKQSKTPRMKTVKEVNVDNLAQSPSLIDSECKSSTKKQKFNSRKSVFDKSSTPKCTPVKAKTQSSESRKSHIIQNETLSSASPSSSDIRNSSASVLPVKRVTSKKLTSPSKATVSQRGIRRKLSPSSSAERAAKKLKISSPKKPDKNKRAALLVLGKANRKQLASQNLKVLLKQKILKKAIKQSSAISARDDKSRIKTAVKLKKSISRSKSKKLKKKEDSNESSTLSKDSTISDVLIAKLPFKENAQETTPRSKKVTEIFPSLSSKNKTSESTEKSDSRQAKISEFSRSMISSDSFTQEISSSSSTFEKSAESYFFNSNRRCSKRLSSKNDTGRPDFIELSPTALGLIPKNVEVFKTPRDNKRRSSSMVTPKNVQTTGIIKSASTSKIGNRKSVRFSSKDVSINSGFCSPSVTEKSDFDSPAFHTPNITVDVFVSPLTDKITSSKKDLSEPKVTSLKKEIFSSSVLHRNSNSVPKTCVRKLLQSPQSKIKLSETFSCSSEPTPNSSPLTKVDKHSRSGLEKSSKNELSDSAEIGQVLGTQKIQKSLQKNLTNLSGVSRLLRTSKDKKSPKNDLTNVAGVKQLFKSPRVQKSPKNDLSDVRGVKKLLRTPKVQRSPKNDLTDVRGVKRLLRTPKVQKSPKNDLSDVRGVKKLLRTPKVQRSPKNDLTDVAGVKQLFKSPRVQKSPKNDLSDVRGVKKLLRTPKVQKSPKNDLTDVRGVKRLLRTPKVQKSPKNDLSDVRGVKKLLRTPKVQGSPKNDLTDVAGVKKLFKSPRVQKSPKNDLSDLRGVKKLLRSPKHQKSPKNDLTDVIGVQQLFTAVHNQRSPRNSLLEVNGIEAHFVSPTVQRSSKILAKETKRLSSQSKASSNESLINDPGVISTNLENNLKNKIASQKMHVKDFRAIRGRRTIYSSPKGPKNDLSDVAGVRELFSRHKPISDYNINLTGVPELFDLPGTEDLKQEGSIVVPLRRKKIVKNEETKIITRGSRLRKATNDEINTKRTRNKKSELVTNLEEKKPIKRKAAENVKTNRAKKGSGVVKRSKKTAANEKLQTIKKVESSEEDKNEVRSTRKRKNLSVDLGISPPRLRRKVVVVEKPSSKETATSKKTVSRSRAERSTRKESPVKSVQKVSLKAKSKSKTSTGSSKVQSKTAIKTGAKENQKVQSKRSQASSKKNVSSSGEKITPRKTRRTKTAEVASEKIGKIRSQRSGENIVKSGAGRKKLSPVAKRSTRRK